MKKLVSIVIPYYKKKKYIKRALNSIYNQTYKNFEIIIVYDDIDLSDVIFLKKLIKKGFITKLIINKKNLGAGKSRNIGIKNSRGEYVAFLDSDDYWKKNKLKIQITYMIRNDINFSFTSYKIISSKSYINKIIRVKKELTYDDLIKSCDIGLSTVVMKRKILTKYQFPTLKTKEDYVLWLSISKKYKLSGINKILTYWQESEDSLSSNTIQKIKDAYLVYKYKIKFSIFKSLLSTFILSFNSIKKKYL